jgi:predicted transcriptional regulator
MDKGMMEFEEVSKIANFLSRDYAADFLRLLVVYKTISASEAASLLEIHIKTAQDFLDGLVEIGILKKEQVFERKRPYFRYTLIKSKICIETDFSTLYDITGEKEKLKWKIREKNKAPIVFTPAASGQKIASVTLITGEGRKRKERKISITETQGKFLFYLPFPTEPHLDISTILEKAGLEKTCIPEILDILELLKKNKLIDIKKERR